jgi:hypothetical protein
MLQRGPRMHTHACLHACARTQCTHTRTRMRTHARMHAHMQARSPLAPSSSPQAEYVHALSYHRGLTEVASTAGSLAAVSAYSATLLVVASTAGAITKAAARLAALEASHGLLAADRQQWKAGCRDYDIGLDALKTQKIRRCGHVCV